VPAVTCYILAMKLNTTRQARAADAAAMHRVRMSVIENRLTSVVLSEHDYLQALEDGGRGWVIEEEGKIVGFAVGNAKTGNIWALFVEPGHEGKGYGRQLHDAMVAWLWAQGSSQLWLTTERDTRAERFYRKAGWACTGTVKGAELRFELQRPESHG
jgi:GNAT superfamily N-acetyltransferase